MKRNWGRNKKKEGITTKKIIQLYEEGKTQSEVGKELGIDRRTVYEYMKKANYKVREQKMQTHPSWKGGVVIRNGYPFTRVPEHPRATKNGYVALHLLKMEEKIGKKINGEHPIHHIDFNKMNCNQENLWLCKDDKEHRDIHCSLVYMAEELFKKGILGFKEGRYFIKNLTEESI